MTNKTAPVKTPFVRKVEILKPFKVGDIVEGVVVGIGRSAAYLDLGPRGTGIIYGREFMEEKEQLKGIKMGDAITAKIVDLENEDGYIELSLREAGKQITWEKLKEQREKEETFRVKITGANKGGLLAELYGIQAFLPVSQLHSDHYPKVEGGDPSRILEELQKFIGEDFEVQVCDIDAAENKIILSERAKERGRIKEVLEKYKVADVVEGTITGIVDFGAFIAFPADAPETDQIEGLIHISEIDWQIIENPAQFLKVGEKVQAQIIDISNDRVSLSLKAMKGDPWKGIEEKYQKLDVVQGKVTKINPFGAFVEIEPKIQGLAHISEFGTRKNMEDVIEPQKTYAFQILELNAPEHRMTLKLVDQTASPSLQEAAPSTKKPGKRSLPQEEAQGETPEEK
ncbi:MAG: S1 RNA-binding domain-containing protein [Candidatus Yanofskybacteria bacterium]|nr:S1 RNA-binding domain-containing protein [Candidatus Yanofskybacteria bacterium]